MTIISDLPLDLAEEILSRVSITSLRVVRSTCKQWNAISKDQIFRKKHCDKASNEEFLVTITNDYSQPKRSLRLDLNNIKDMPSSIKVIGYDNKNNHKILRFSYESDKNVEVYNFKSNSWRILDITPNCRILKERAVALKGNTYFLAGCEEKPFVIRFDFTTERFGSGLHLPVEVGYKIKLSSSVREEQLAVLSSICIDWKCVMEIWITTKIEPNAASWSKFFKVNLEDRHIKVDSFFIEKEKKVAVVSGECCVHHYNSYAYNSTVVVGEDGYYKNLYYGQVFSYVPSSVQIPEVIGRGKRKGRDNQF